ncbi:Zn-ribbon domain-containing OB-fold protein [Rhodococcus qingshengii]|uniref:Zn-ribbon domain-containing OB-fold protein n=1 Tax=Rhodococcus qingshengii TaxID=334542 RepID=UPI001C237E4E|nr:OB-fold domain-containing protein [Rhodococcus qingshengii]QXC46868.1 OB-fold domain-containing protein [Rhodococcus qingshengii]
MPVLPLQRDVASAEFFDGTARRELLLRRCVPSGHWSPPASLRCVTCGATTLFWARSSGHGRIISWAVVHRRPTPEDPTSKRIPVAIVEMDEGPWLRGQIVTTRAEPSELAMGLRVEVAFDRADGGEAVPVFHLDETQLFQANSTTYFGG